MVEPPFVVDAGSIPVESFWLASAITDEEHTREVSLGRRQIFCRLKRMFELEKICRRLWSRVVMSVVVICVSRFLSVRHRSL